MPAYNKTWVEEILAVEPSPYDRDQEIGIADRRQKSGKSSLLAVALIALLFGFAGGFLGLIALDRFTPFEPDNQQTQQFVLQEGELITEIASKVEPSVVSILTETNVRGFFSSGVSEGAGSGIILTEDGLVVTNSHVIPDNFREITIIASDGEEYSSVELIDRDPFNDIAYLQIEGASGLQPAELGDSSETKVGEKVVAIGNALGRFDNTVTSGIISGLGRPIIASGSGSAESLTNLFQTDAAINPGNSGGPLVNMHGQVIAINTAVAEGENIGFAIPIEDVTPGIESVKANGELIKPYLGVRYISISPAVADEFNLDVEAGAYVLGTNNSDPVIEGSPADEAGIQEEDIITSINGVELDDRHTLSSLIGRQQVGEEVTLTVQRDGETLELTTTLQEVPASLE